MKKLTLTICLLILTAWSHAAEMINFGFKDSLASAVLKEDRAFYVHLPSSYGESKANKNVAYPVIYLLDGDVHRWKAFVGVLEGLSHATLEKQVQESIVVAIPNTNRNRDLTPTVLPEWTFDGQVLDRFEQSGEALQFLEFIKTELMPQIDKIYRTSDKKVLVGESFGALFGANVLLKDVKVFTDYLLIDPTSLWDDNYLNRTYAAQNFGAQDLDAQVYFAFANNAKLGKIGVTNLEWGQALASKIASHASDNFRVEHSYFEDETHGTVALMGWYHGLKYLLAK